MIEVYDYAIVGAGAAGLQLAFELSNEDFFSEARILIIDKIEKKDNDHTWSFWEEGNGPYDHLLWNQWSVGAFYGSQKSTTFNLDPYRYKTLRSSDFYDFMKSHLDQPNISWITAEVKEIKEFEDHAIIITGLNNYTVRHCFDSRISEKFKSTRDQHIQILQHFKGYFIKTEEALFDDQAFTMMDYRVQHPGHTSFTYVLPLSSTEAMIEFTLFDHELLEDALYDHYLKKYISEILKIDKYEIREQEFGVIPMTTYPFHKDHSSRITKIGTAGGWVRASSGYQFKNAMTNARKIKTNIMEARPMNSGIGNNFQRWMDHIFLSVLDKENHNGSDVFQAIYLNNQIQSTFSFLDEDSSTMEKFKMIFSVPWGPFLRAFWRWIRY